MSQTPPQQSPAAGKAGKAGEHDARHAGAAAFWSDRLDPRNIEREAGAVSRPEDDAFFARTPDLLAALAWLGRGGALRGAIVDVGAGLGGNAFAMAQAGHRVIAVDTSPQRLRALRERARALGLAERIECVVGAAEQLPFAAGSLQAVYTKSVMIHTDMPIAAGELRRVLAPGGRTALVEPQPRNPFAMAYRRWLAPQAWRGITRYFGEREQAIFVRSFAPQAARGVPSRAELEAPLDAQARRALRERVRHFYLLSFLAFGFQFALPWRAGFRLALAVLGALDRVALACAPWLRREAWFCVVQLEQPQQASDAGEASEGGERVARG